MKPFHTVDADDIAYFERILPGRVFAGEAVSEDYAHDEMPEYGHFAPDVLLEALSTQEVSAVLGYCNARNIAVTPRGAGTGLCGGCVATGGGVLLERHYADVPSWLAAGDQVQTCVCVGIAPAAVAAWLRQYPDTRIDRLVVPGQALAFDWFWDGQDLLAQMSRQTRVG